MIHDCDILFLGVGLKSTGAVTAVKAWKNFRRL